MQSRRNFISGTASFVAFAPTLAQAHSKQPFKLDDRLKPQIVGVREQWTPGQIWVVPGQHLLYLILEPGKALRYGVGVGQAGLTFKGTAIIERKAKWPWWRPTNNMIRRNPGKYARYANGVPGGPNNPLGARALYLYRDGRDTYYRIHGTTDPSSIGRSVSNGCIRMLNEHVEDLYERVPIGTVVTVV
ncbi:MAG: L,D-transpeptidase [Rhodobacter sp.]|nr:L,D-transpeptidase [Rhodobacter sp.]